MDKESCPYLGTGRENYEGIAPSGEDVRRTVKVNVHVCLATCYALIKTQVSPDATDFKIEFCLKTEVTTWAQIFDSCVTIASPPLKQVIKN